MTSNTQQAGINACLEDITKALKDGAALVAKLKARLPPNSKYFQLLQRTLRRALDDVEKEKEFGLDRFGKAFGDGDSEAAVALQQITNQLQSTLLARLLDAVFEDDPKKIDLTSLVDAAELCRTRTNTALLDFRLRLKQQLLLPRPSTEHHPLTHQSSGSSTGSVDAVTRGSSVSGPLTPNELASPITEPSRSNTEALLPYIKEMAQPQLGTKSKTWTRPDFTQDVSGDEASTTEEKSHRGKRAFSLFKTHLHKPHVRHHSVSAAKAPSSEPSQAQSIAEEPPRTQASSPGSTASPPTSTSMIVKRHSAQQPTIDIFDSQTDNLAAIWGNHDPDHPIIERRDTSIAPDALEPLPPQPSSPVLTQRSNSNSYASTNVVTPTPENEYLGYCKGAWKLQTGDRKHSVNKCREAEAWSRHAAPSSSTLSYLACAQNRCAFRSHISHTNVDFIWNKVFFDRSKGIKYRWTFLAKSHVAQRVVVRQDYTFQCMFCIFLGQKRDLYHGISYYLEHISKEHRGAPLNDVMLHRTSCINDHEAGEDEQFDINILPLSFTETRNRSQSEVTTDDLVAHIHRDGRDSVLSAGGSWSEGLSEFKPRNEFDRGEI